MIEPANKTPTSSFPKGLLMTKPSASKKILLEWIRTEFNLPKSVSKYCDEFYMRVWDGSYVADSIQNGILVGRFDDWIVHFQSTPEVVKSAPKVACSFRKYQGKNYVVLKVWKEEEK